MALEITKPEQLEKFLTDKPTQWSHLIAARAAIRVLPVALSGLLEEHWLTVFRACFISWAVGKFPGQNMSSSGAYSAISASRSARGATPSVAGSIALSAARAAALSIAGSVARSAASSAALSAARSTAGPTSWEAISADANGLAGRKPPQDFAELALSPLWPGEAPPSIAARWKFWTENEAAYHYAPWINWYQALLTGDGPRADYFGPDLTLRIAQQPDEWWDRPAEEVNADIAAWLAERDTQAPLIPEPEPGTTFGITGDGRIGFMPSGIPSAEELGTNEGLLEVLGETVDDLTALVAGSNAFALLYRGVGKYAACLRQQPLSLDRLYARGIVLENTRAHLQKGIEAGDLPDMALEIASGLDSVLAIHGPLIASTHQGQVLLERSHQYEDKSVDIAAQRLAARDLANAVARSDTLFTEDVREEWPVIADGIGSGSYPARSTQVAMSGNNNLLIVLALLVAKPITEAAITASIPGALAVGSLKATFDAAWMFWCSYEPVIAYLVQVSGPDLAWMKPVLRLVAARRGQG